MIRGPIRKHLHQVPSRSVKSGARARLCVAEKEGRRGGRSARGYAVCGDLRLNSEVERREKAHETGRRGMESRDGDGKLNK